MADESMWIERAQSAEAKLKTMREAHEQAVERVRNFKSNFGVKERSNGEIVIDFQKFVERLGHEMAAELKNVIDEKYGTKPVAPQKRKYVRKVKPEAVTV